jgi:hypothetical protein
MLNHAHFYHGTVRNSITVFGKLFNDIYIKRDNADGSMNQFVKVPITYGPKEKWLVRSEMDPDLNRPVEIVLPRMSFEITDFTYDTSRKLHSLNQLIIEDPTNGTQRRSQFVPVPYNLTVQLYIITKTQEDALQIVEQILPFFTPHYNLTVNLDPKMGYTFDVPTVLNSVTLTDDYEGSFEDRRTVIYTLTFTMKTQMFGPVATQGVIQTVSANLTQPTTDPLTGQPANSALGSYSATAADGSNVGTVPSVTEGWN